MIACWEALNVKISSGSSKKCANDRETNITKSASVQSSITKDAPSVLRMSNDMNAESVESRSSIDSSNQKRHIARIFTYSELKAATKNFRSSNALGEGGFGKVYKGWIDDIGSDEGKIASNITVAVKVLNQEGPQGHKEWLAEVKVLGQLRHPHLVRLIGYCCENEHRLLVYEYMQLGSLENHLFQKTLLPLSWANRMRIAYGSAKGLAFLHKADISVIYRDFKTSNVLLDSDFTAKLSDFGLAKNGPQGDKSHVSTRVMGTYGYAAPEYMMTGHLTARSDVYSFGVVLVELLTGRQAIDKTRPDGEHNLVEWARPYLRDKWKFLRIIDPRLEGGYSVKEVQMVANLAHQCLSRNPKTRPLMSFVVEALEPLTKDLIPASYTYVADSGLVASSQAENGVS